MVREQDNLDGLGRVIQVHVPVGVRILVSSDRAGNSSMRPTLSPPTAFMSVSDPPSGAKASCINFTPIKLSPRPEADRTETSTAFMA
jgi:hypothetical protein